MERIALRLQLYGRIRTKPLAAIIGEHHIYTASGATEDVEHTNGFELLKHHARSLELDALATDPSEVVGPTECSGRGFRNYCRPRR
jgi:hypothetical protein